MNPGSRKTTWIAILAAAAISAAYVYLIFLPQQRVIRERAEQLTLKRDYVIASGSVAAAICSSEAELERTEAYNAAWVASAPPEDQLAEVLGRLDSLVVASGATPTRFDPAPAVKMAKLAQVPVVVGCSGTFAQISQFLYDVESLHQVVWIDRVQLEKPGQDAGSVRCEIDLAIFAGNSDKSDQRNIAGQPIREKTDFQRRLSASVR